MCIFLREINVNYVLTMTFNIFGYLIICSWVVYDYVYKYTLHKNYKSILANTKCLVLCNVYGYNGKFAHLRTFSLRRICQNVASVVLWIDIRFSHSTEFSCWKFSLEANRCFICWSITKKRKVGLWGDEFASIFSFFLKFWK
jgi:hypothetical protein